MHSYDKAIHILTHRKSLIGKTVPTTTKLRRNLPQIIACSVKNVMLVGFGMTLGFPTVLIGGLEDSQKDFRLSEEQLSWVGALNMIFVPLGCLASGPFSEMFGRRRAMQIANVPLACSWLMFRYATSVWHLYGALAVVGTLMGLIEAPVLTYLSEITTPNLRGILFSSSTLFVIFGALCTFYLGSVCYWRSIAQYGILVPLLAINLLFLIPESPHWLIKQRRHNDAQAALAWLRGWLRPEDVQPEFDEIKAFVLDGGSGADEHILTSAVSKLGEFCSPRFTRPYALVAFVFLVRHFSGITSVQTYAVDMFARLHAPMDKYKATTAMGVCEFAGCVVGTCLIGCLGKRRLAFGTMLMSAACLLAIPLHEHCRHDAAAAWLPMWCLFAYCFFAHSMLRTLPWILVGEVYTPQTRSVATGISAATGYIFGFMANKMYFVACDMLTLHGLYVLYAVVLLAGVIIMYYVMPETEGKSLDEICQYFAQKPRECIGKNKNLCKH